MSSHSLADGPGLLRAQVQGNVLLALIKLPQVLLLLLVHHNVDPGDGFAHNTNLGELGGSTTGNLRHTEGAELDFEVFELLGQLLFLLLAQL